MAVGASMLLRAGKTINAPIADPIRFTAYKRPILFGNLVRHKQNTTPEKAKGVMITRKIKIVEKIPTPVGRGLKGIERNTIKEISMAMPHNKAKRLNL